MRSGKPPSPLLRRRKRHDLQFVLRVDGPHRQSLRRPLAPGAHQRKVQAQAHRLGAESSGQHGIALQLRPVALDLAVEELFEAAAAVLTRLVVDDPAYPLLVDEAAIEDDPYYLT